MKLRVDLSCVEADLYNALIEAKKIMQAVGGVSCSVKVFHDVNRQEDKGHGYVQLTEGCDIMDKIKIYNLEKKLHNLTHKP